MAFRRRAARIIRRGVRYVAGRAATAVGSRISKSLRTAYNKRYKTGTRSKTITKKRSKSTVKKTGNSSWAGYATWGKYRSIPKKYGDEYAKQLYLYQEGERIENSDEGRQGISTGTKGNLFTLGEIQAISSRGSTDADTTALGHYRYGSLKTMATNATNQNIKVTVYNVVARKDLDAGITPSAAWLSGLTAQNVTGSAAQIYMGATPMDSKLFCQEFKIWKCTNYYLSEGESFIHHTTINANKTMDYSQIWQEARGAVVARGTGAIKNFTQYVLITIQCFPSHETTTNENVGTSIGSLDVIHLGKIAWYPMIGQQRQMTAGALLTVAPTTAYKVVNFMTGLDTATYAA